MKKSKIINQELSPSSTPEPTDYSKKYLLNTLNSRNVGSPEEVYQRQFTIARGVIDVLAREAAHHAVSSPEWVKESFVKKPEYDAAKWLDSEASRAHQAARDAQLGASAGPLHVNGEVDDNAGYAINRFISAESAKEIMKGSKEGVLLGRGTIVNRLNQIMSQRAVIIGEDGRFSGYGNDFKGKIARLESEALEMSVAEGDIAAMAEYDTRMLYLFTGWSDDGSSDLRPLIDRAPKGAAEKSIVNYIQKISAAYIADSALSTGDPEQYFKEARKLPKQWQEKELYYFENVHRGRERYVKILEEAKGMIHDVELVIAPNSSPETLRDLGKNGIVQERLAVELSEIGNSIAEERFLQRDREDAKRRIDANFLNERRQLDLSRLSDDYEQARRDYDSATSEFTEKVGASPTVIESRFWDVYLASPNGATHEQHAAINARRNTLYVIQLNFPDGSMHTLRTTPLRASYPSDLVHSWVDTEKLGFGLFLSPVYFDGELVDTKEKVQQVTSLFPRPFMENHYRSGVTNGKYEKVSAEEASRIAIELKEATETIRNTMGYWQNSNALEILEADKQVIARVLARDEMTAFESAKDKTKELTRQD